MVAEFGYIESRAPAAGACAPPPRCDAQPRLIRRRLGASARRRRARAICRRRGLRQLMTAAIELLAWPVECPAVIAEPITDPIRPAYCPIDGHQRSGSHTVLPHELRSLALEFSCRTWCPHPAPGVVSRSLLRVGWSPHVGEVVGELPVASSRCGGCRGCRCRFRPVASQLGIGGRLRFPLRSGCLTNRGLSR